jgi:cytochrome c
MKLLFTLFAACGLMAASLAHAAVDADAAQAQLKKSDCLKCHSVDKKKDGPSFKETAKKYKGKADAEDKLTKHVTTSPTIEIDGKKEEHKSLKTKDAAEVKNVVQWILAQ